MGTGHILLVLILLASSKGGKLSVKVRPRNEAGGDKNQNAIAQIMLYRHGMLCSGIHLKPWIVLTAGDCLNEKEAEDVYVIVKVPNGTGKNTDTEVEVKEIVFHPEYAHGNKEQNIALLNIYAEFKWKIDVFLLPRIDRSSVEILSRGFVTYIHYLKSKGNIENPQYELRRELATLNLDSKDRCGGTVRSSHWYCVATKQSPKDSIKWFMGYPLFMYTDGLKRCLGIYTNFVPKKSAKDKFFLNIYPYVSWIEEFVQEHPFPPK